MKKDLEHLDRDLDILLDLQVRDRTPVAGTVPESMQCMEVKVDKKKIEKSIIGHVVDAYESLDAAIGLLEDLLQDDADEELTQPGEEALDEEETQVAGEEPEPLRDCPFCGSWAYLALDGDVYCVECEACGVHGPKDVDAHVALADWNRRSGR